MAAKVNPWQQAVMAGIQDDSFKTGYQAQAQEDQQKQAQQAALAQMFQSKQTDADIAAKRQKDNLATAQGIIEENAGRGRKVGASLGADGQVNLTQNETDPMSKLLGGQKSSTDAAYKMYMAGLPKIKQTADAAAEGLQFTNDPKNIGSLGTARTLVLKAMGMNRYNEKEAEAVLPPTLKGFADELFNKAGGDNNPLNDAQKASLNSFFQHVLKQSADSHDMLKKNSAMSLELSPYGGVAAAEQFKQKVGAPFDESLKGYSQKFAQLPTTPQGQQPANQPIQPAPQPSMVDKLRSMFGMSSSPQANPAVQAAQQPPQQAPAPQAGAAQPPMSFEEFKAARAAGKIK